MCFFTFLISNRKSPVLIHVKSQAVSWVDEVGVRERTKELNAERRAFFWSGVTPRQMVVLFSEGRLFHIQRRSVAQQLSLMLASTWQQVDIDCAGWSLVNTYKGQLRS